MTKNTKRKIIVSICFIPAIMFVIMAIYALFLAIDGHYIVLTAILLLFGSFALGLYLMEKWEL